MKNARSILVFVEKNKTTGITKAGLYFIVCLILGLASCADEPPHNPLDTTFGSDGIVTTDVGNSNDYGYSVAIQSDGKILVAGSSWSGTESDFALVRYNTDGSLDNTFDTDGMVTTAVGSSIDVGYSITIQPDGKILVTGYSYAGTDILVALVRYNNDGSLDNGFGAGGKVTTNLGSGDDYGCSVILQVDGKIIVAGSFGNVPNSSRDFALMRYNSNGSLDNTFGTGGIAIMDNGHLGIPDTDGFGISCMLALQGDGKIVVAGGSFVLARYNLNGTLDTSFGSAGMVNGINNFIAYSVAMQSDGKILVAGSSHTNIEGDFALARYNIDGSLDNSFGSGGLVVSVLSTAADGATYVTVQSDGKILVAGSTVHDGSFIDFALVRYNSDGSEEKRLSTDVGLAYNSYDTGYSIAIQPDGKIVVAGTADTDVAKFALVRYNGDL